MAHDEHSSTPPAAPADMVAARREGWHTFTRGMFWNCIAAAAVLVLLLLVFKVF